MKKGLWTKITAVALSVALLSLTGCNNEEPGKEAEIQEPEKIEVIHPLHSSIYGDPHYSNNVKGWENEMKNLGYTGIEIVHQTKDGTGFVVTTECEDAYEQMVNTYVIYETEGSVYINKASEYSILEKYEVCEIDGNPETEEIMLCFDYMGNGGAGNHETQVWQFDNSMPWGMFSSDCDLGYASTLNDGYEVVIDNIYTEYQTRINIKDNYESEYLFDENGKPDTAWGAQFDGVYETVLEDVDNDGDDELVCKSYSSVGSHANSLGDAVTTIDYNKDLMAFVVVDADFVEYDKE